MNNSLLIFVNEQEKRNKIKIKPSKFIEEIFEEFNESEFTKFIVRTVDWILSGHYGEGVLIKYDQMSKRMNRKAWLFCQSISMEFNVPYSIGINVWKKLSEDAQIAINEKLIELIEEYDKDPLIKNEECL
jgi:lipid-binding SYLF domain-containing protein